MTQLALDLRPPAPPPNADLFHPDGSMKLLLWPGDGVRMMHERTTAGCCSARCPVCNPDAFRCEFGCCPPKVAG